MISIDNFSILAEGLDHPETVTWGLDGNYYAGGEGGQIYRISPNGNVEQFAETGGLVLGVCLDGENYLYACDSGRKAVLKVSMQGQVSVYSSGSPERTMVSPNHLVFTSRGDLYVSDSGVRGENNGCLYCIHPGGETRMVDDRLRENPNGLAIDPEEAWLYILLSEISTLVKAGLNKEASLEGARRVVELDRAIPDGLAFDREGNLYLACDAPNSIYRLSPQGELTLLADDWRRAVLASPTSITFGGPELSNLVVSNFGRYSLAQAPAPVPGMPLRYPQLG